MHPHVDHSSQPLAQRLIKKSFWTYILSLLVAPTGYFIRVIVSNDIPLDEVGLFYSIISFILLISIYNDLGLTESLQYFLPKYRIEKAYDKFTSLAVTTICVQLFTGISLWAALRWWAPRLAEHYFHSEKAIGVLRIFVIYFFAVNIFQMMSSFYVAFQDIIREKIIDVIRLYTVLWGTVVLRTSWLLTLTNFSEIWLIGLGVALIISICYFVWAYGNTLTRWTFSLTKTDLHTRFGYAFRVFLGVNAATLFAQLDMQMTIAFLWPQSAWYYTNYLSLNNLYLIAAWPVLSLIFPLTVQLITQKQADKLSMLIHMLYKYFSVWALLIAGVLIAFWPDIASFLFGKQYVFSGILTSYTAFFIIFPLLQLFNYGILAGMWKVKERMFIIATWLGVTALLNYIFLVTTTRWIYSIVIGTVIGQIFTMSISTYIITKTYRFGYNRSFVLKNLLVIFLVTVFAYFTKAIIFVPDNGLVDSRIQNILIIAGYCCVYVCTLALLNRREIFLFTQEIKKYRLSANDITATSQTDIV